MNQPPEALFADAQAAEQQDNWPKAVELYQAALAKRPNFLEAHHNLALALRHLGQIKEALDSALSAAILAPDHPTVQFSLGLAFEQMSLPDEALNAYKKSVTLRPTYIAALNNLGKLLEQLGEIPESIHILERGRAQAPSNQSIRLNLANSYLLGGLPDKSQELLSALIAEDSENALAHNSLGAAAHVIGENLAAIGHFRDAIHLAPSFAEAHENLAQALLMEAQYDEAWVEYEWRWQNDSNAQSTHSFKSPAWNGESLKGQTLLIHAEQGFGDVIQFARLLAHIDTQGGQLIFACHAALVALLSQIDGVDSVIDINAELPDFDQHAPLLSLPRLLGINGTNIPSAPYLTPETADNTGNVGPLRIGIAWAGMPRHEFDPHRNRSCPVELFKPLLNIANIELFSLQTGPNAFELAQINDSGAIIDLNQRINSFNDTAKLLSEIDIVLTIDTALAHLAGAMGKNVWILLATCADWRWQSQSAENPWYPTAQVFRQISPGNWTDPLDAVISEIRRLIP